MVEIVDTMPKLTIVTAVDRKFFRTTCQFLRSCIRNRLHIRHTIILYDLGMELHQRNFIDQTYIKPYGLELQSFRFKDYPAFLRIRQESVSISDYKLNIRNNSGAYAWKPVIICEVLEKTQGMVLWMDSGTIVLTPLEEIETCIRQTGLFAPLAGTGKIRERTHSATLEVFQGQRPDFEKRFRSGGICGFNYQRPRVLELVREWRRFSLIEDCIAPTGADDSNHRYDQSILSLLLYRYERTHTITLTASEIDISSTHPISCISTRNKVPNSIPLWCDPFIRCFFAMYRFFDILILKLKTKRG